MRFQFNNYTINIFVMFIIYDSIVTGIFSSDKNNIYLHI